VKSRGKVPGKKVRGETPKVAKLLSLERPKEELICFVAFSAV